MTANKILLVDDDSHFQDFMISTLTEDFVVHSASSKEQALQLLEKNHYDLCLFDYKLPDGTGHDITREMRSRGIDTHVFLLTAFADKNIAINSIDLGISCLLEKPFEEERLRSAMNRVLNRNTTLGDIRLDEFQRCIFCGPEKITLTGIEYRILDILIKARNRQVSREHLQKEIWGQSLISKHTLDTHIYNLKKKSEKLKKAVRVVHGTGFIFDHN